MTLSSRAACLTQTHMEVRYGFLLRLGFVFHSALCCAEHVVSCCSPSISHSPHLSLLLAALVTQAHACACVVCSRVPRKILEAKWGRPILRVTTKRPQVLQF